jgi:hypothetical protein
MAHCDEAIFLWYLLPFICCLRDCADMSAHVQVPRTCSGPPSYSCGLTCAASPGLLMRLYQVSCFPFSQLPLGPAHADVATCQYGTCENRGHARSRPTTISHEPLQQHLEWRAYRPAVDIAWHRRHIAADRDAVAIHQLQGAERLLRRRCSHIAACCSAVGARRHAGDPGDIWHSAHPLSVS